MNKLVVSMCGAALLAAGTYQARGAGVVIFSDDFESHAVGTIAGQGGWGVFAGSSTDANVVSNGSTAFAGTQFLSMGTLGTGPKVIQTGFDTTPVHTISNYVLSMAVRLEEYGHNGLQTILNANGGPRFAVHTFLNAAGHIFKVENYSTYTDLGGTPLLEDEWYNVTYFVQPAVEKYNLTVVRASTGTTNLTASLPFAAGSGALTTWSDIDLRLDAGSGNNWLMDNVSFTMIPEPSVSLLLCLGGMVAALVRRTRE